MNDLFTLYSTALPLLLRGMWITIQVAAAGIVLGLLIGTVLGIANSNQLRSKLWGWLADSYVAIVRGTPLFVQVLIIYFALPTTIGWDLSPIQAGIMALALNSAAYISEIIRGAANGLPVGQWEACQTLGLSTSKSLTHVILPQTLWQAAPALVNEVITLIKESSILMIVGVPELTKATKDLVAYQLKPMELYLLCAALYFALTTTLQIILQQVERRKPWKA